MATRKGSNTELDEPFCMFWDEYHDIEQTSSLPQNTEDEVGKKEEKEDDDKNGNEIQWFVDAGLTNLASKLRDHRRIEQNDEDMRRITSSLTRSQANAVRRRIDYLNDVIQHKEPEEKSLIPTTLSRKHKDVRDIFDQANNNTRNTARYMKDNIPKQQLQGQRHVSKSVSEPISKDVPVTVHQKVQVSSTISESGSPPIAPKPQYSQKVKPATEKKKTSEYHDDKQKKSEARRLRSEDIGPSCQPSELGKHAPGSQLTFMTGVQRDRIIQEQTKSTIPNNSTPKSNDFIDPNIANRLKLLDEHQRCHSFPEKLIGENSSCKCLSDDDEDISGRTTSKLDKVEVDGCGYSIHTSNTEKSGCISINADDDLFDVDKSKNNISTETSNKILPVVTSTQTVSPFYSGQHKNDSSFHTITSIQTNTFMSPSRTTAPYMTHGSSIPCDSEEINSSLFPRKKDKILKSASCSSSAVTCTPSAIRFSPSSPSIDITPGFNVGNNLRKDISVSSLDSETDIVPFDLLSKSTSPDENNLSYDPESKKCTESPQMKSNINYLRLSDAQHNDFGSGSEDGISLSSRESYGSLDDLGNQSLESDVCIDPTQIRINMGKDSPEPCQSPTPDLDARLDVGPIVMKEPPDVLPSYPNLPKFPPLPNFNLSKDITGMTEVDDLSDADMEKVRSIALIELTALFDTYRIPMNRKKQALRPKFKDSGVFGVPLTSLSQREGHKKHGKAAVPRVFKEILIFIERNGLKEEGVLRVSGSQSRIKALREAIDKNDLNLINWQERTVKDVSACLKQFLRELPEPVLSSEYQNTFLSVEDLPDRKIQLQALNLLVILLKPIHQKTLKALLNTLKKIIDNEDSNKMGLNNVAMIMAPNLLLTNGNKIEVGGQEKAEAMTDIMRMLIKYQSILWTIPSFMVGQIRCIYDAGVKTKDPKAMRKAIQRQSFLLAQGKGKPSKSSGSSGDELDHGEIIIRVKAPSLNKQSQAMTVRYNMTAADIIAKFQWRRQNSQKEKDEIEPSRLNIQDGTFKGEKKVKYHLYEAGGNIGERRLEPCANITAILKLNPNAEWVLK